MSGISISEAFDEIDQDLDLIARNAGAELVSYSVTVKRGDRRITASYGVVVCDSCRRGEREDDE